MRCSGGKERPRYQTRQRPLRVDSPRWRRGRNQTFACSIEPVWKRTSLGRLAVEIGRRLLTP